MKQDYINALIKKHEGLVYYTLDMLNCINSDEAKSVAYEALWRALKTYDASAGAKFSTYAVTCIKNAVYDLFRKIEGVRKNEVPLEDFYNLCVYDTTEDAPEVDYSLLHKAVDDVLNRLSGKKYAIAHCWLESDMSTTAIAAEVSCSQSYASQTVAEFKNLLRKELIDAGYSRDTTTDRSNQ